MEEHPDYPHWHAVLARLARAARTFNGTLFRACSPEYANTRDLLTGEGAYKAGGRWNAPGSFPMVYLSLSFECAIAETLGLAGHYGFDPAARLPLTLVAVDAVLGKVLDLSDASVRKAVGVSLASLIHCDWRRENRAGREAPTQALGRAAFAAGAQGIIVPSALKRTFRNLNVFPQNLAKSGVLKIRSADKLPPPGVA